MLLVPKKTIDQIFAILQEMPYKAVGNLIPQIVKEINEANTPKPPQEAPTAENEIDLATRQAGQSPKAE